jgi:hypothetical protein
MVTVTFVALQSNWKQVALEYRQAYQAARVEATSAEALAKTTIIQLQGQITQINEQVEELQTALAKAEADIKTKDGELVQLTNDREAALADAKRATQLQVLEKERADRLEKSNQDMLAQVTELQKRNQELDRHVRELTMQVTIKEEQRRAAEEQRYALEQQLLALSKGETVAAPSGAPAGLAKVAAPAAPASVPIKGQIVEVKGQVASISVGSADGVIEGMSFVVYRGADYLGKLRITMVEPNRAGGDLTLVRGDIRPKDSVRDERSFRLER